MTTVDGPELRVLTWNLAGLDEEQLGERTERLCLEILIGGDLASAAAGKPTPPMPHVLALQEVVRISHKAYLAPHLGHAGYTLWPEAPLPDREHYEVLAVRAPWVLERCERRAFTESPLARAATIAALRHEPSGARATMITAHCESLRSGSDARVAQARDIASWMHAAELPAVFAGDTNLRDAEWQSVASELGVSDAWVTLGSPKSSAITWRPENNPRAGSRFDRVWLAGGAEAKSMRLRSSPRNSDHAGVEVLLTIRARV